MANYIVTGAAGFIGAAVAKKLIEYGHYVVTIDNLSTGYKENIPEGVDFIEGDCGDPNIIKKLPVKNYTAILHIAGQSSGEISFDDPIYDIRTNAESTVLLLQFALENKCNRFIYASTMSVYGVKPDKAIPETESCEPESFYGVAKLASEHYLRIYQNYGINSTCLRLFNVYGPGQNLDNLRQGMVSIFLAQMLRDGKIHVKGSGSRFRDFIYIDDVVEAFIACIDSTSTHGENINVGTGIRTTVEELIATMFSVAGKEVNVEYSGNTSGDIHGIYADTNKMKNLIDLQSCALFSEGIKKMVKWAETVK